MNEEPGPAPWGAAAAPGASRHTTVGRLRGRVDRYRRASGYARFHYYSRWGLYLAAAVELTVLGLWAANQRNEATPGWAVVLLMLLGAVHATANLLLIRTGLRHYLGQEPFPARLLTGFLALTLFVLLVPALLAGTGRMPAEEAAPVFVWFAMFAASVTLVLPMRRAVPVMAGVTGTAILTGALAGVERTGLLGILFGCLLGNLCFSATFRPTAWGLRVLDELHAGRESRARLAVAEERLRFARDLHDVLGRNLSVIALKSELAAQLSRRGSETAVDQMVEVQRIARESQQELHAVVRGYREADLVNELAGARGVLEAAGIRCRVEQPAQPAELSLPVRATLGWVVREGATNVLRHAAATECTIVLSSADGRVRLSLENDGADRGPEEGRGAGSGLPGLRERLTALGGGLTAQRVGEGRFRLAAEVPAGADA
ncbi:sensor histidine kinase [Streptomyces aidingensis]|uniref:Two-component system, NarL family, sensor histidine kinase DesK n=1 Tax=Streptomyces aidingensis TaxID=910347 RepID=A0A1I1Q0A4_9ACTN|nr:histidine kinase [Streptomyces aidingensis]SFD15352.1 two-component system, NarL family, sensor histidine kinase DesK [Streptomyces aidingensis]